MKKNPKYEIEIRISDLFFYILARWRFIILAVLLGVATLCGYRFIKTRNNSQDDDYHNQINNYNEEMTGYQQAYDSYTDVIDSYNNQLKKTIKYRNESIKMRIDPQNEWCARCDFFVEVDQTVISEVSDLAAQDLADELLGIYRSLFYEIAYDEEVVNISGVQDEVYLKELINWAIDSSTNSFYIIVIGLSEDQVSNIIEYYQEKIEGFVKNKAENFMKHKLSTGACVSFMRVDSSLRSEQKSIDDTIYNIEASINNIQKLRGTLVKPVKPVYVGNARNLKRYAIIGFLLGGFVAVVIFIMNYVINNKIRNSDDLQRLFNIPLYGAFPYSYTKKPNRGIDKILEKIRGTNKADNKVTTEHVATMIEKNYEGKKVLIASTTDSEMVNELYKTLKELIGDKVELSIETGFLSKNKSIDSANLSDTVLLVEIRNETVITDVERFGEIMLINECDVAGYVVL